jgi:hypothetical protein
MKRFDTVHFKRFKTKIPDVKATGILLLEKSVVICCASMIVINFASFLTTNDNQ